MASLWFTWTFDARTAGMGAFQNDRHQNNNTTTTTPPAPSSPRYVPASGAAARPHLARAVSAPAAGASGLAMGGADPSLTKTPHPVDSCAADDRLKSELATATRADPVPVKREARTAGTAPRTPRAGSVGTSRTDSSTARIDSLTAKISAAATKTDSFQDRGEPAGVVDFTTTGKGSGDGTEAPESVLGRTDAGITGNTDLLTQNGHVTAKPSSSTSTSTSSTSTSSTTFSSTSTSAPKPSSEVRSEAVMFLGLLRHNEDLLVERTKRLLKRDRQAARQMFGTEVEGWTPLHACTLRGARKLLKLALKSGVAPDLEMGQPDGLPGRCSALHLAAHRGDVSLLQLLVQGGASVSKRDAGGRTPLFYAAAKGNTLAARKLIKYGADLSDLTAEQRGFYREDVVERRPAVFLGHPRAAD